MTDNTVVVDFLLRLFQAQPPLSKPIQTILRLGWTVRQRCSKSAPRHSDSTTKKKAEPTRASPTMLLSWSRATFASGGVLDGFEESSLLSKPTESLRSKVCCFDFSEQQKKISMFFFLCSFFPSFFLFSFNYRNYFPKKKSNLMVAITET